jgi:hypothetical protein
MDNIAIAAGVGMLAFVLIGIPLGIWSSLPFGAGAGDSEKSCGMTQVQIDALERENKRIQATEEAAQNAAPKHSSYYVSDPDTWHVNGDRALPAGTRASSPRLSAPRGRVAGWLDDGDTIVVNWRDCPDSPPELEE